MYGHYCQHTLSAATAAAAAASAVHGGRIFAPRADLVRPIRSTRQSAEVKPDGVNLSTSFAAN